MVDEISKCIMRGGGTWLNPSKVVGKLTGTSNICSLFMDHMELPSNRFVRRGVLLLLILIDVINLKISRL